MEMTADRGRGYNSSEKNKKPNQDISGTSYRFNLYSSKKGKLPSRKY